MNKYLPKLQLLPVSGFGLIILIDISFSTAALGATLAPINLDVRVNNQTIGNINAKADKYIGGSLNRAVFADFNVTSTTTIQELTTSLGVNHFN